LRTKIENLADQKWSADRTLGNTALQSKKVKCDHLSKTITAHINHSSTFCIRFRSLMLTILRPPKSYPTIGPNFLCIESNPAIESTPMANRGSPSHGIKCRGPGTSLKYRGLKSLGLLKYFLNVKNLKIKFEMLRIKF
jgi:hypothetical protein